MNSISGERPGLTQGAIEAWVLAHPGCTSVDVAHAFESTSKLVGAHLTRLAVAEQISQHAISPRHGARFAYGPPDWSPPVVVRRPRTRAPVAPAALVAPAGAPDVQDALRARLDAIARERAALDAEEGILRSTLMAHESIGGRA